MVKTGSAQAEEDTQIMSRQRRWLTTMAIR